ncbi:hypothetical protein N0V90_007195 [Kalmusia sp. IMI 367209]|nr:hypothetical protein N0V90_007195 [Kalmusia sp. IMI 367209]
MAGAKRSQTISTSYQTISSNYHHLSSWRPHLPHLPASISTSFRKPSSTALKLENGTISHVPSNLQKSSPNLHLVLSSLEHDLDFCKTTMSAMVMNYPPPTIVNGFGRVGKAEWEREKLQSVLVYLEDARVVKDEDLILLVDGRDTWFHLPSEVMVRQYMTVVEDANRRLHNMYGKQFSETIIFGARKTCEGNDMACKQMPPSVLPNNTYGEQQEAKTELVPARFLDADMLMGPVKDLRKLYRVAAEILEEDRTRSVTVQSVMSKIFGEQMLARAMNRKAKWPIASKLVNHLTVALAGIKGAERIANVTVEPDRRNEFSVGLDYTHALFQPLTDCADNELVQITRSNQSEPSQAPEPPLDLPVAFQNATGPFWAPDFTKNDPSPNEKPAYIDKLEFKYELDKLKHRDTPWTDIPFVRNTYTGAIPATLHVTYRHRSASTSPEERNMLLGSTPSHSANVTWTSLWYSGYERALLRRYFRTPQSPIGYHNAAVGGDLLWDQRGGRGGVWTAESGLWLPWGEVDGVCGTYDILKDVFGDKKGVWFHEDEDGGGRKGREEEEEEWKQRMEKEAKEDAEWAQRVAKEQLEEEKREREKLEKERQRIEEKDRLDRETKERAQIEQQNAELAAAAAAFEQEGAALGIGKGLASPGSVEQDSAAVQVTGWKGMRRRWFA